MLVDKTFNLLLRFLSVLFPSLLLFLYLLLLLGLLLLELLLSLLLTELLSLLLTELLSLLLTKLLSLLLTKLLSLLLLLSLFSSSLKNPYNVFFKRLNVLFIFLSFELLLKSTLGFLLFRLLLIILKLAIKARRFTPFVVPILLIIELNISSSALLLNIGNSFV